MTRLRPLAALVACAGLSVAWFGSPLLRRTGLSVLATDLIQFGCMALAVTLAAGEIRVQLARERAPGVPESKGAKVVVIAGSALALVLWSILVLGKNR